MTVVKEFVSILETVVGWAKARNEPCPPLPERAALHERSNRVGFASLHPPYRPWLWIPGPRAFARVPEWRQRPGHVAAISAAIIISTTTATIPCISVPMLSTASARNGRMPLVTETSQK